jgi:3-hydroxybutyryl-CoA dehydrogenase
METDIKKVAVIGAGLMGLGIGLEFARFGYSVGLYNTNENSSRKAQQNARDDLDLMVETELITDNDARETFQRMQFSTNLEETATGADYVSESVLEQLKLKREIFRQLDRICPPPAILSTNTSAIPATTIATATQHPERVVIAHYFQPPHFIPLVEVVGGEKTDREVVEKTARILRGIQKKVVVIPIEVPGFAGNRIQGVIGREIRSLVDQGVCTPEMIDDIIQFGFGRRMAYTGWFKRQDLIGLDFGGRSTSDWGLLAEHLKRGELGMKSGKGFYDWSGDKAKIFLRDYNKELIRLMKRDMERGAIERQADKTGTLFKKRQKAMSLKKDLSKA